MVDSEIVWDDPHMQAAVDKAFSGKKPSLHTVVGLGGSTATTLNVPAGNYDDDALGKVVWPALGGQLQVGDAGRSVKNCPGRGAA